MSVFLSSAPAEPDQVLSTHSYSLLARPEPGVMPRVVELFAKRGLVPLTWRSTASHSTLAIEVQIAGLERDVADYIGRCMRQIVGVETVLTSESHLPG
jgi:acetolactate synthase small subunit